MIGVLAGAGERAAVAEFFELFKAPWEFWEEGREYTALVCAGLERPSRVSAPLVVQYAGSRRRDETGGDPDGFVARQGTVLRWRGSRLPIFGPALLRQVGESELPEEGTGHAALWLCKSAGVTVVRVGYDLFAEIGALLTAGQPAEFAGSPTVDLHIAILRELVIAEAGVLVEIPPCPAGYRFLGCLTHDVDHPSLRHHRFDHTLAGFLYRATLGSLARMLRGRLGWRGVMRNWWAAARAPLVQLGVVADEWLGFTRYVGLERGFASTFFVIPSRGVPGQTPTGPAPLRRASSYGASDITAEIEQLRAAGCEIGLHGIDAWLDAGSARNEAAAVQRAGGSGAGVRMHWLYFEPQSLERLEAAGFDYDTTVGFNETVGFRAGTGQAYRPLQVKHLLELPLLVMDTALFYPSHLNLSEREARIVVDRILDHAEQDGGCVTVNWHDRSIAPERLWGDFYVALLDGLVRRGAWCGSAAQVIAWFRQRRAVRFTRVDRESGSLQVELELEQHPATPPLRLRIHRRGQPAEDRVLDQTGDGAPNSSLRFVIPGPLACR